VVPDLGDAGVAEERSCDFERRDLSDVKFGSSDQHPPFGQVQDRTEACRLSGRS
jgi:hypothetical protein